MVGTDLNAIRHALTLARSKGYDEVELDFDGIEFAARLARSHTSSSKPDVETPSGQDATTAMQDLLSPVVGFFHSNGKRLEVGRKVKKGEVVAVVSGLGLNNDVEAPADGEVVEVKVREDQGVEFGEILAKIEVAP
jgi:biotin carboxyl carrier protein